MPSNGWQACKISFTGESVSALPQVEVATVQMGTSLAEKLKQARQSTRLSTRAVAEQLAKKFPQLSISHATLANYEKGRSSPNLQVLCALAAIYERPINWFLQISTTLSQVRYRNLKSKVGISDRHWYEANAQRWIDAYVRIENRFGKPLVRQFGRIMPIRDEP